ncbi:MAG: carboxypeptidase regulatory-like domain-containing protein, partial [Candidatus Cloacimonadaceae bacterium]
DSMDIIFDAPPPPPLGSISGHVIGLPPNNNMMATVGLVSLDDLTTPLPGLTGHVGWSGFYVIRNIPVGTYKACFLGQDGLPVAYSEPVTVLAFEMIQNVDIILGTYTAYSISGSVFNSLNEPVTQGVVELRSVPNPSQPNMNHMHRVTQIDSLGNYAFTNVPAGQYIVAVWTQLSPVVFYPSTFDITQATPVVVTDADLTGINVTLPVVQTYTISGYVKDEATEAPLAGIKVRTDRMGFHHFPMQHPMFNNELTAITDAAGFYSITAPFGRYTLAAIDTTHFYRIQWYDHAFLPFQADVIVLNQDFTNVNFDLYPRLDSLQCSVSGVITENGEPVTYPVTVVAVSSDEDWEESTISNADGSYTISNIRPGHYYIVAYSLYAPPTYYNNVLDWQDADLVTVYGAIGNINFNLVNTDADGPSNLSGVITDSSNQALSNVIVLLANSQNQLIGFARTDSEGNYYISNVPTDSYTVSAVKLGFATATQDVYLIGNDYLNLSLMAPTANDDSVVPALVSKVSNYPNPFNPNTTISLALAKDSNVTVKIYNVKGQVIKNLLDSKVKAGSHTLQWDGTDDNGSPVSSGIYMVKLQGEGFATSRKMTLMK